jgi:uncharacterized protein YkwD
MNSSGHRKNILTPTYDREGIGVAISADGRVYITEISVKRSHLSPTDAR